MATSLASVLVAACACGGGPEGASDAGTPLDPADYTRPERGEPVGADELAAVTGRYLELLEGTRYFAAVAERAHGWPRSDPSGRYWYGTWWSGITVTREGARVTYRHSADGADNNGLRTAPLLEGACYAHHLWRDAGTGLLVRALARGFSSWMLAMERQPDDPAAPLLARAAYPDPVLDSEGGRELWIDYSLNRPGLDSDASEYVHLPANPHWGDLYVKNKRSKDDIGHMLRAIAQVGSCRGDVDPDAVADLDAMASLYEGWSQRVEDDGFAIATYDKDAQVVIPSDLLANFVDAGNAECNGILAVRLFGRKDPGTWDCGNGIGLLDEAIEASSSSNAQILRSFHEAAADHARLAGAPAVAYALLEGLAARIDSALDRLEAGDPPPNLSTKDFAQLILHAAAAGVPLTWREVRWLHQRIDEAHATYLDPALATTYRLFDPATPDGAYAYEPGGDGLDFEDIGLLLGACAAGHRSAHGKPVLDCDQVSAWRP